MWRREPFRLFFPLGTALAWVGVGHWVAYWAGWIGTYSCLAHGLVQTQGFLLAFATGFLLTAIPRRTAGEPPAAALVATTALALCGVVVSAFAESWRVTEVLAVVVMTSLIGFAARRFVASGGARRPPAAFVLVPIAILSGIGGAVLVAWGSSPYGDVFGLALGRLLVEQGVFLGLVMGVGGLVLPLMSGAPPPDDLGSSPRETRRAIGFGCAGLALLATFVAESIGSERAAPLARAFVVAATLSLGAGTIWPPTLPGWNRRFAWIAVWLVPSGLALAGLLPDYRVPALHITFIGGFGLLAFAVATHVTASHLPVPVNVRDGRSVLVAIVGGTMLVAMLGRLTADAMHTYFEHLAAAALLFMAGSGVWVAWLGRYWAQRERAE
ncbi:MAG: NnrS family protein [Candidatus Binatia bacterium]